MAAARRFLRVFLAYETGALTGHAVRRLRETASPALAGQLLAQPARLTAARPARARVRRLVVGDDPEQLRRGRLEVVALLDRDGQAGVLTVTVQRAGRWQAVSVR